jgi:hypothetical protein
LASVLTEYEDHVFFLNWVSDYEVRFDNRGLTEASSKRFLEELLAMVRRGIDRKRTFSTSSGSSGASGPNSSTPRSKIHQGSSLGSLDME